MTNQFDASSSTGNRNLPDNVEFGPPSGGGPDVYRLISVFRRHLKLFLAVAILVMVVTIVVTARTPPSYTANASLIIDARTEQVLVSEAVLSGLPAETGVIDTEVEVLRSRQLAERVVDSLNLVADAELNPALKKPGPVKSVGNWVKGLFGAAAPDGARRRLTAEQTLARRQQVVDAVMRRLSIKRAGLTYVMNVSFTSSSPEKAALIANAFADRYLTEQLEAKYGATQQANSFLTTRTAELRTQLEDAERAVEQYRTANNLLSTEGATLTEQEISAYNQQLATVRAQQAEEEARLSTARRQLATGSSGDDVGEALESTVVQRLRDRRAEVSGRVSDLRRRYGPRYPDLISGERELQDIDGQIQAEIQRIISNLEARVSVARQRTASVQGSLGGARGTLATNNAASVRLNELIRSADSVRALYQTFLDRSRQTTAGQGIEQTDARIVSRAKAPSSSSSPNVALNLMIGMVLALAAGLAAVVLSEILDSGLSTAEDIERRLGLPSLGSVPLLSTVAASMDRDETPVDYVIKRPLSSFAEAIRALRTSVLFSRVGKNIKVIMLASALPSEGKSTTAVCLARVSAQAGQRVVLVDCDLRRRNVNGLLGFEPVSGLIEVLNGTSTLAEALVLDEASGAYILPLAANSFTPKDVFGSEAMATLVKTLRDSFDLVILDTAPVLAVADTRVLSAQADVVLMLAKWRKTPERALAAGVKMLEQSGAHVAGIALTQVDMKAQSSQGYGDAGYYYAEYKKYYSS